MATDRGGIGRTGRYAGLTGDDLLRAESAAIRAGWDAEIAEALADGPMLVEELADRVVLHVGCVRRRLTARADLFTHDEEGGWRLRPPPT